MNDNTFSPTLPSSLLFPIGNGSIGLEEFTISEKNHLARALLGLVILSMGGAAYLKDGDALDKVTMALEVAIPAWILWSVILGILVSIFSPRRRH